MYLQVLLLTAKCYLWTITSKPKQPQATWRQQKRQTVSVRSNTPVGSVVCETHTGCEIKVLTNVISEGREEFYNLSTTYSTVHKLFLVCGKQNKMLLLLRVKRLQFGNDSLLLFPTITGVCQPHDPWQSWQWDACLVTPFLTHSLLFCLHYISELLLKRVLRQWSKGGTAFKHTMPENWTGTHKRLCGNLTCIIYTVNSKQITGLT